MRSLFVHLLLIVNLSAFVLSAEKSNSWSFSLGNVHLFDIPKFNLFGSNDASERSANIVENSYYSNEVTIDPDIIEDSLLKTVGFKN